jgi:hypothetical protein
VDNQSGESLRSRSTPAGGAGLGSRGHAVRDGFANVSEDLAQFPSLKPLS